MFTEEDWGRFTSIKFKNFRLEVITVNQDVTLREMDIPDRLGPKAIGAICAWYASELGGYGTDDGLSAAYGDIIEGIAKELGESEEDHYYNMLWDMDLEEKAVREIIVRNRAIDGFKEAKEFTNLEDTREYCKKYLGENFDIGKFLSDEPYAISGDGINRLVVEGATWQELFPGMFED